MKLRDWAVILIMAVIVVSAGGFVFCMTKAALEYELNVSHNQVTNAQVREIYNNLGKYTGLKPDELPPLYIVKSNEINAMTDGSQVVIFTGMIKYAKSESEVAGVLAHELGHVLLSHMTLDGIDPQEVLEGNADKWGAYLVLRAGYDVCDIKNLWSRLREDNGDFETNSDHPNYSYRYWQLDFPQCGGNHG